MHVCSQICQLTGNRKIVVLSVSTHAVGNEPFGVDAPIFPLEPGHLHAAVVGVRPPGYSMLVTFGDRQANPAKNGQICKSLIFLFLLREECAVDALGIIRIRLTINTPLKLNRLELRSNGKLAYRTPTTSSVA